MKTWMIVRALTLVLISCVSQLTFAGGNLLQLDLDDASVHHSVKWTEQQFPIVWHLSESGYPGSGIDNNQLTQSIEAAFDTWAALSNKIQFTNGGVVSENSVGIDGINLLTFTDQDYLFPSGVSAFAINYTFAREIIIDDNFNDIDGDGNRDLPNGTYPPGTVYEADIVYNGSLGFEVTGANSTVDLQATTLHEVGHFLGLSHSVIIDTVMYPFLYQDISAARVLSLDDRASASHIYSFNIASTSSISGKVINGYSGEPVVGAHVFVSSPVDGKQLVGAFSLDDGQYFIPGVRLGYVGIEPLNGSPAAKDPARINEVIKNTFDIDFIPEFYDANESNTETSSLSAQLINLEIALGVFSPATNIDITTNTSAPPGIEIRLLAGLNIFSYPVETLDGFAAFDLLQALGDESEINSIDHYNSENGRYERVYWKNGAATGINFSIKRGEAYLVHMQIEKNITFEGQLDCPLVQTKAGFNLIGVPCPPAGYSAFDLLTALGGGAVSVKQYNRETAAFEVAIANVGNTASGIDFPIVNGVGYIIEMLADQGEVSLTGGSQNFPAFISGISPGRAITGSRITILGLGFSETAIANEVLFNGVRAAVISASNNALAVTVPAAATSGPVTVGTGGAISNSIEFIVESNTVTEEEVANKDIIDGQTVQGNLSNNNEQDRYSFIASKGAYVTATAIAATGTPDLMLFLEGSSGEVLASDDNSAGGTNPSIKRFKVKRTGRHTVVVAASPGTGAGAYTFTLDIENTPPVKDITIISGDAQTGVMGSQLPTPMEIYITGPDGFAIAGVSITLTTDDNVTVSTSVTAASYQVLTNSSGIVKINMILPNSPGLFDIVIEVPGYGPKIIKASSVASLPVAVEIEGNGQDCGGNGCPVNQALPAPYKLRFLDDVGQPVPNVLVKFSIVSGEGALVSAAGNVIELSRTSNAAGEVSVTHSLGNRVFNTATNIRIPQIVAATGTNPGAELWLFESIATAGAPAAITSLKTNNLRMTMGTAVFNAVVIQVTDQYGNPVANADVVAAPSGGLLVQPGILNGQQFAEMKTNEDGIFAGMVVAGFDAVPKLVNTNVYRCDDSSFGNTCPASGTTVRLGSVGVEPTKDEFGASVKAPYVLTMSVGGVTKNIAVDVDMGPRLILTTIDALKPGDSARVGSDFDLPVNMFVTTFQRMDECSISLTAPPPPDEDSDGGDWRDEDFSITRIRRVNIVNVPHSMTAVRIDGEADTVLLDSPRDEYNNPSDTTFGDPAGSFDIFKQTMIDDPVLTITTLISATVKADEVHGPFDVIATIPENVEFFWSPDDVCLDGPTAHAITWKTDTYTSLISIQSPDLTKQKLRFPLRSVSPQIKIDVNDQTFAEPNPDPLQIKRSHSGIDLTKLEIKLNGNFVYGGSINTLLTKQYPNYIEAKVDGANLPVIDVNTRQAISPGHFEFIYYPTAAEINLSGPNIVDVLKVEDRVDNVGADAHKTFVMP